ncbi:Cullin-associated NEDD8-dissociated protein 1 [Entomortierella lignicola]|nr:Cullin-associated NEDD8-dissociated protein 1 [Entomortierella lignicola]
MGENDNDFRFMALNDLITELQSPNFHLEEATEKKVVDKVLLLMKDKNGEVQNQAVKCLGSLVKKVQEAQLQQIVDNLCAFVSQDKEDVREIASIGLKTVMVQIPINSVVAVNSGSSYEGQMDSLDILSEVLLRFGNIIATTNLQKQIANTLFTLLGHNRPALRKRATLAIGYLVAHVPDDVFEDLLGKILNGLETSKNSTDRLRTYIQVTGTISRSNAPRFGKFLPKVAPSVIKYTDLDDDELRENALQTLEAFVLRCPTEITPYIDTIIDLGLKFLRYDPNYDDGDDEDDEDEDMGSASEEEEDDDDGDYSDDDDMSWKVRRTSAKLLSAIIGTRQDLLGQLYSSIAPSLINRFKEREETVRVEILQTFITLLRQTNTYGGAEYDLDVGLESLTKKRKGSRPGTPIETDQSPKALLRAQVPRLTKNLSKQMVSKSVQTRVFGYILLKELVTVLKGGLENNYMLFVPSIQQSLSTASHTDHHHLGTNSNLKIEALGFLRSLFRTHNSEVFQKNVGQLCSPVISAIQDKFYKISSEALVCCMELIRVVRSMEFDEEAQKYTFDSLDPSAKPYVLEIYKVILQRVSTADADQEVKERSILCLGVLLSRVGDELKQELTACLPLLLEKLQNELTRLMAVKTFSQIVESPVCADVDIKASILQAVPEVASLLRKSNRPLKVASLHFLDVSVRRFGKVLPVQSYDELLNELKPLITDEDLHLLPLGLTSVVSILHANPSSINVVKQEILPSVLRLVRSPLIQGQSLDSLLALFAALVRTNDKEFSALISGLVEPVTVSVPEGQLALPKQAFSTIAQCIAVLCLNSDKNLDVTVAEFLRKIEDPRTSDSLKYLSLITLGEIGRRVSLGSHATLHTSILAMFDVHSEEVRSAAAFAIGNVSAGNVSLYVPIIMQEIQKDSKKRYLLLHALKEVITRYTHKEGSKELEAHASEIWILLFDNCESQEEGTRNVVAECLGKLTLTNPYKFLPELQARLRSDSAQIRGTVVSAFKYTFTDNARSYDELLRPLIVEFLSLMKDTDLNVRRLSLSTLDSAAHNKPYLIRDVLGQLLPLLYQETNVVEELIHIVEMGPFKHRVDDGLEIRKSAFECMYTLLEKCRDKVEIFAFIDRVLVGLVDQPDIKMLCHLTLVRLSIVSPTAVAQRLDDMVEPLQTTLNFKLKATAVKQELEKNQELVRSALRAIAFLSKLADPALTPKFEQFVQEVRMGPNAYDLNQYIAESDSRDDLYSISILNNMPYDPTSQSNLDEIKTNHIHLALNVDFTAKALTGSAQLELEAIADNISRVVLDTSYIDIRSVSESGKLLNYQLEKRHEKYGSALTIDLSRPLQKGEKTTVTVEYATTKDCTACQWLEPSQTVGKKHPYLFTQCQAIHARSLLPCQDSPSIKLTYSADITTPLHAVMSAVPAGKKKHDDEKTTFTFEQKQRIPSYLIALAVGNLEGREIGPRSTVWTEPEVMEAAAWEFVDTENFIRTGEEFLTPYDWGRYDLLVLPASFPYGGMENPCLTFVTPSLLAGDRSLVDVVAHEIAHSWMGNLVTTENWEHFW